MKCDKLQPIGISIIGSVLQAACPPLPDAFSASAASPAPSSATVVRLSPEDIESALRFADLSIEELMEIVVSPPEDESNKLKKRIKPSDSSFRHSSPSSLPA